MDCLYYDRCNALLSGLGMGLKHDVMLKAEKRP